MPRASQIQVIVAAHREDMPMLKSAFDRVALNAKLQFIPNGADLLLYLQGGGKYRSRSKYPLPDLLLVDLALPTHSGFEVDSRTAVRGPSACDCSHYRREPA